jgi:hypothetical protein
MKRLTLAALVFAVCAGSLAIADGDEPSNEAAAKQEKPKAATPIQKILKELKGMVAREKARPEFDEKLVKDLELLIQTFESEAGKPIRLDDLAQEDKERLKEEVKEEIAAEREAEAGEQGADWQERAKARQTERALEGVELNDPQREKVETLLNDFADATAAAWQGGDVGMINQLKKDLEKRLKAEVGNKKARQIISNVNKQLGGRGRWGG